MVELGIAQFVLEAFPPERGTWEPEAIRGLAGKAVPPNIGGTASWLLFGDANALWARWFVEGLADPALYVDGGLTYPHLLKQVRDGVQALLGELPADEQKDVARSLSDLLWREVERRAVARRAPADRELRLLLWELYPRCWICGAAFPDWARAVFLREDPPNEPTCLSFVDFVRPRGARLSDLDVHVEHVLPHAAGGPHDMANLRLACGWCNRVKGARTLLYDAEGRPRSFRHPKLGLVSIPQPFWVIRLLAMRRRCEHPTGCEARTESAELTVAPRRAGGAPNPANLMVVCEEHDPLREVRLVGARYFTSPATFTSR